MPGGFHRRHGEGVSFEVGMGVRAKEVFGHPKIELEVIDYCIGTHDWGSMSEACD